jgi:hypothetical protein
MYLKIVSDINFDTCSTHTHLDLILNDLKYHLDFQYYELHYYLHQHDIKRRNLESGVTCNLTMFR